MALSYEQLEQRHPDYDAELWEKIDLLYKGGFEILEHAKEFIPRLPGEGKERYQYRLKHASYLPYFAQVLGYLVGTLFLNNLEITENKDEAAPVVGGPPDENFYKEFSSNANLNGATFPRVMRSVTTDALKYKRGLLVVDMPQPVPEVESRAAEEALGAGRAYCQLLPIEQLLDWSRDPETKRFRWCVLRSYHNERKNPEDDRSTYTYRYKVWRLVDTSGGLRAIWEEYETERRKVSETAVKTLEVRVIGSGATSFPEIPVVELELPDALWVGNKIGPLCEEHYRRRSELCGAMGEANVEIPTIGLGPEISGVGDALPAEVQQDPSRGENLLAAYRAQGYTVIGRDDWFKFIGPSGQAFQMTGEQLNELRDEIYRVVNVMALSLENTAAAVGRSGESKREDRSATANVLSALADLVRGCAIRVYSLISQARVERAAWAADGLDAYDLEDAGVLLERAVDVQQVNIPSKTFKREHLKQIAFAVLRAANSDLKAQIGEEIDEGVEQQREEAELLRQHPPPPPGPPEAGSPPVKPGEILPAQPPQQP